jgi:hypothetical protein
MSESTLSCQGHKSDEESWYAGFDVVDFETTPLDELPEDNGFHLICPIDGCKHEASFEHLGEIKESSWTEMSFKDQILTDGTTLKESYCPSHSLDDSDSQSSTEIPESRQGLGIPLDEHEGLARTQNTQ